MSVSQLPHLSTTVRSELIAATAHLILASRTVGMAKARPSGRRSAEVGLDLVRSVCVRWKRERVRLAEVEQAGAA
jgi:hypothetical protein